LFLLPLALGACASTSSPAAPAAVPAPAELPFVDDDYGAALAQARAAHKLLFIDAWAPWCHSCLALKAYTFRDARVRAHAGDVVWASIDTEKPVNATWVNAHPMRAWPTLFVVDPSAEKTVLEWPSTATADELVHLLEVAEQSTRHEGVLAKADARAIDGNTAAAAGKTDDALAAWRDAIAVAPDGWAGRAAIVESMLDRLLARKDAAACVDTADRELAKIARGGARAATLALLCAGDLPEGPGKRTEIDRAIERVRKMVTDDAEPMLDDDRSGLYQAMTDVLQREGRDAEAKSVGAEWATFLDGRAAQAPDPAARAVYDTHRVDAYLLIGAPERAVPMLQQSAKDFPGDYNPPARLARALLAMKRYDDALAAIDRALALVYGPRTLRLYSTKADILEAKGDKSGAAAALKQGVARVGSNLPPRYVQLAADLTKRAQALEEKR
jgi:tetratricopeptide (TPR) repeat protein